MKVIKDCELCLFNSQLKRIDVIEDQKEEFLQRVQDIIDEHNYSAPHLSYLFDQVYKDYYHEENPYTKEKKKFNDLVMSMEKEIEEKIEASKDPLETSIVYARIGNYIDFSALDHVDPDTFISMLEKGNEIPLDQNTYALFLEKCKNAKKFMLLADNCGEIVLDKLFVKQLKKRFPNFEVFVLVRGDDIINDATREDAMYCGFDQYATILDNGRSVAGTIVELLSNELKSLLYECDVILSKGQGNYEGMSHGDLDIFYSFLCKCEVFAKRFNVERFTGMFVYEGK